jgi:hypothetical protein
MFFYKKPKNWEISGIYLFSIVIQLNLLIFWKNSPNFLYCIIGGGKPGSKAPNVHGIVSKHSIEDHAEWVEAFQTTWAEEALLLL